MIDLKLKILNHYYCDVNEIMDNLRMRCDYKINIKTKLKDCNTCKADIYEYRSNGKKYAIRITNKKLLNENAVVIKNDMVREFNIGNTLSLNNLSPQLHHGIIYHDEQNMHLVTITDRYENLNLYTKNLKNEKKSKEICDIFVKCFEIIFEITYHYNIMLANYKIQNFVYEKNNELNIKIVDFENVLDEYIMCDTLDQYFAGDTNDENDNTFHVNPKKKKYYLFKMFLIQMLFNWNRTNDNYLCENNLIKLIVDNAIANISKNKKNPFSKYKETSYETSLCDPFFLSWLKISREKLPLVRFNFYVGEYDEYEKYLRMNNNAPETMVNMIRMPYQYITTYSKLKILNYYYCDINEIIDNLRMRCVPNINIKTKLSDCNCSNADIYEYRSNGKKYAIRITNKKLLNENAVVIKNDMVREFNIGNRLSLDNLSPQLHHGIIYHDEQNMHLVTIMDKYENLNLYMKSLKKENKSKEICDIFVKCFEIIFEITYCYNIMLSDHKIPNFVYKKNKETNELNIKIIDFDRVFDEHILCDSLDQYFAGDKSDDVNEQMFYISQNKTKYYLFKTSLIQTLFTWNRTNNNYLCKNNLIKQIMDNTITNIRTKYKNNPFTKYKETSYEKSLCNSSFLLWLKISCQRLPLGLFHYYIGQHDEYEKHLNASRIINGIVNDIIETVLN